jgi:hypothetical protein
VVGQLYFPFVKNDSSAVLEASCMRGNPYWRGYVRYKDRSRYYCSERWKELRLQALFRDKFTCQRCGSKHDLQVHHRDGGILGCEVLKDLETVCRMCHRMIHWYWYVDDNGRFWEAG